MFTQLLILFLLLLPSLALLTHHLRTSHHPQTRPKTAIVLVLGDVGRSPRMMYHARSLVKNGYKVWLVGYRGTPPLKFLEESENVVVRYIPPPPEFLERVRLPFLVKGPAKVIYQVVGMIKILSRYPERLGAEYILIQVCSGSLAIVSCLTKPPVEPTVDTDSAPRAARRLPPWIQANHRLAQHRIQHSGTQARQRTPIGENREMVRTTCSSTSFARAQLNDMIGLKRRSEEKRLRICS